MNLFSKKYNPVTIFYFLFASIVVFNGIIKLSIGYSKECWQITEWLLNYQGGFVRRGLFGELFLALYNHLGISPYYTIIFLGIASLIALILFFVKSFIRNGYPIFILPFVFFLGGPLINDFWVRKDVLLILIFILIIRLAKNKSLLNLLLVNLVLILGVLTHEAIGFFTIPILLLIYAVGKNESRSVNQSLWKSSAGSFVKLFPALATFALCIYNKGSLTFAEKIWNSWKPVPFPIQYSDDTKIPAAIDGLSWSLQKGISFPFSTLKNFDGGIYAPIAWILILLLIYFVLTNTQRLNARILNYSPSKEVNKINISNILVFQLICIAPLFMLGWDYGRWVFFWITSSFTILLLVPAEKLQTLFPRLINNISSRINIFLENLLGKSRAIAYGIVLFLGVPCYSWHFYDYYSSTPIYITLQFISNFIYHLLIMIKEAFV